MEEDNIEELRGAIKNALEHRQDIEKPGEIDRRIFLS